MTGTRRAGVAIALAVVMALAGCTSTSSGRSGDTPASVGPTGPFSACPKPVGAARPDGATAPDVALPCLAGGPAVSLARAFGKPTVVTFWASWCAPCREELPVFQRYADRTAGQVLVVGVVTGDRLDAAASLATDLKVSFPALYDRDQVVIRRLGRNALPLTLLLDARGKVVSVYQGEPLTDRTLEQLVARYTPVSPSPRSTAT